MAFALDASTTLPWCFRDEATSATDELLSRAVGQERIYVPANWPMEVLQGLTRAMRAGRIPDPDAIEFLRMMPSFNILLDRRPIALQWSGALSLIQKHRLSAYDAGYLALAIELQVPLATLDDRLRQAAFAEGVPLAI